MFSFRIIVDGFLWKRFDDRTLENGIHSFRDGLEREQHFAIKWWVYSVNILTCYAVVFKDDVKMQSFKVLQRIWIKICAEACSVWLWEFFRCTCRHMSTARVKTIPFCKLLVKWIDNGTTYFNSIVAQILNTVMQHLFSTSTGVFSSCKLPLEEIR